MEPTELVSSDREAYSVDSLNEPPAVPELSVEDGLADDDSWVEELSQRGEDEDEDLSNATTTPTATDSEDAEGEGEGARRHGYMDREEELRGYNRSAIDFTLHTIVEESCEESEVASMRADNEDAELEDEDLAERRRQRTLQHHHRLSASELEKYFFFGLGDGRVMSSIDTRGDDTASEVSSECSESLDSLPHEDQLLDTSGASDLASSRLEKYFLSGFMGFSGAEKQAESDESGGSVGSDSEGQPSPSQRRKRLVRARGTPRSHNSSLDNLLLPESDTLDATVASASGAAAATVEDTSESEAGCDDTVIHLANAGASDGSSSDTIKRKKQLRKRHDSLDEKKLHDLEPSECRTPTPGSSGQVQMQSQAKKQQQQHHHSRDSGFVGSNDDLLKAAPDCEPPKSPTPALEQISEDREPVHSQISLARMDQPSTSAAAAVASTLPNQLKNLALPNLVRKDSFNNWSSDEETNLMMSKMRQFFKNLIVATANAQQSKPTTPNQGPSTTNVNTTPSSQRRLAKSRPAQLAYFENELTRLMKTVPGINDEQVREIVEYLSSEDTWSDSYDSSDYTSSDLEGGERKGQLKAQISASCQQIINKFEIDEEGDRGDGGLLDESQSVPMEALVYQKLVASFSKVAAGGEPEAEATKAVEEAEPSTERSPQLFAKVMQHIGTRLVALMHEVSSGNETPTPSPQGQRHHRRLQAKISATTTEDEEDEVAEQLRAMPIKQLKLRSKSHDLLLDGTTPHSQHLHHQATVHYPAGGVGSGAGGSGGPGHSDNAGEECGVTSDYERFSWRGIFESALLANGDSKTRLSQLSQLDRDNSSSASALAVAKRRSAGDLLFSQHQQSLSREQLDRVRSCGSIGGGDAHHHQLESSPAKPWLSSAGSSIGGDSTKDVRRSSVPDAIYETDSSDEAASHQFGGARSTLPRSLNPNQVVASTNSLPRLPTTGVGAPITSTPKTKSQSALNHTPSNLSTVSATGSAKSARYRSPGLAARAAAVSGAGGGSSGGGGVGASSGSTGKKLGAGFQFLYSKRDARKRLNMSAEEAKVAAEELSRSPVIGQRQADGSGSPIQSRASSETWPTQSDEDIDRLVAMHQNRSSLSSLGVRSESMASVYSGAGEGRYGTVVVKGQVEFAMQYNYKLSALEVHVVRCKDLAAVDAKRNRSDPYVKVYLLPDKSKAGKRKTKVKKHTLNPIFDETMRFHTPISSLESRTLWLTVWHSDMFGRNDFLGEVSVNLQGRLFDNPQSQWYLLQERSEPFDEVATYRGDIVVGLKYIPPGNIKSSFFSRGSSITGSSSNLRKFGGSIKSVASKSDRTSKGGQLHVLVKEAKHLSPIKANGTCDAFCKSYLLPDRTRSSKQKTPVVKRTLHPSWNYTFVYEDVSLEELSERALELTVWDHDRLASNEFVGGIRFSLGTGRSYGRQVEWMDATGKELSLWQNMLDRPNFWVEGSLVLRSSLDGIRANLP
ncbi:GD20399 [Drosophila simulans]|uniref:GD20399 n=1 Tax=Drosophila simulans TaxID=7240 RepID=B4QZR2_DROSI|nr:GD20399 [Drosophila simulans]